ncbi:hypothetical protein PILCRDRAFT_4805 [Piloderma croceum F 1598]|uniref:Uncharacterized protein n=1 Tax=Piloderma croceum (strain F 1598) TaxID=765440 RepID=A0A0C3C9A9_PILCF|nr:hypothetical protein PILCRDRAFT_4805 [Piloderma croceum F 1598]
MKKCTRKDGEFDKDLASRKETSFFESKLNHMSAFLSEKTEVCNWVLLSDLCKQSITNAVKEEARAKYDAMLATKMKLCSTMGKWVDDAREWFVRVINKDRTITAYFANMLSGIIWACGVAWKLC